MKKINKSIKLVALLIACLAIPSLAGAQIVNNMYFNIDWDTTLRSVMTLPTRQAVGVLMVKPVIMWFLILQ